MVAGFAKMLHTGSFLYWVGPEFFLPTSFSSKMLFVSAIMEQMNVDHNVITRDDASFYQLHNRHDNRVHCLSLIVTDFIIS